MHRQALLHLLTAHQAADAAEQAMLTQTIAFVTAQPACFERTLLMGHVTGSAWIISAEPSTQANRQVVLLHHRKLDRWFQPGGHADGDPDIAAVALREAQEETGLTSLRLVSPTVFDVDVHTIPARGNEPEHLHYDIRFLIEADPTEPFTASIETRDVQWIGLDNVQAYNASESIMRLVRKTNRLKL